VMVVLVNNNFIVGRRRVDDMRICWSFGFGSDSESAGDRW